MVKSLVVLALAVALSPGLAGCKKSGASSPGENVFATAPPELQAMWQTGQAAAKSNDYARAYISFMKLRRQTNLTPEQVSAATEMATTVNNRMYAAASKGDTNAQNAIRQVDRAWQDVLR